MKAGFRLISNRTGAFGGFKGCPSFGGKSFIITNKKALPFIEDRALLA